MVHDLLTQAYSALRHNRRRTTLTMLGMAWGIATVVLLLSYGAGFERAIMTVFSSFGSNMVAVFPGRTSLQAGGSKAGTQVRFTMDDVDFLSSEIPLIKRISPMVDKQATVRYENRTLNFRVVGAYPMWQEIRRMDVASGRMMNADDQNSRARVCVIGDETAKKLLAGRPAVGESIRIDGMSFQVIGVMQRKVQDGDNNDNSMILIPFSTMGDLKDTRYLAGIFTEYEGANNLKLAKAIRQVLAAHHGFNPQDRRAIFVWDLMEDIAEFRIITTGIKVLLSFIGMLTLGIGGIGLMNIMLVAVTQRTREIGVEKALGARRRHILFQFLAEALAITLLGGVLGIALAYLVSWSVGSLTLFGAFMDNAGEGDIHLRIDTLNLVVSTAILMLVGIVSGMLPAIKASRLDPIEALRYE